MEIFLFKVESCCMKDKKKEILITITFLIFMLCAGTLLFIREVSTQLWMNSVRTITECTQQGANSLRIQLETDFQTLEAIGQKFEKADSKQFGELLQFLDVIEPDMMLYRPGNGSIREGKELGKTVSEFLGNTSLTRGVLDTHINNVTSEEVFNIFLKSAFADGQEYFLVREYRTKEAGEQFMFSLYDGTGFSYVANEYGIILVRPSNDFGDKNISNFFEAIPDEMFKENVQKHRSGWTKFFYDKQSMICAYEPLMEDFGWFLISIIPEDKITEHANHILTETMILFGVGTIILIIIAVVIYRNKISETQEHARELQVTLRVAEVASKAKERFLMHMSHDIRTPLNAIIGMTAIAQENLEDKSRLEDCLEKIKTSGTHLLSLINDVLDMAQIENGNLILREEPVALSQLFNTVLELMKPLAEKHSLSLESAPIQLKNEVVLGDSIRIRQILLNIIDNAIKYTPSGGHIYLKLIQSENFTENYGTYRFCCTDTGIGMTPEFLDRIFVPFERDKDTTNSKIAGTGVGLSIAKSLLELMGGNIQIESELGKGSTFTVEFYLKIQEELLETTEIGRQEDNPPILEIEQADYSDKRILLVEDNELNMEIAKELLSMTGALIEEAYDGKEAVEIVSKSPEGYYDLIFMDIQMPVMDGYEATRQIRKLDREDIQKMPIFALSANALAEDVERSRQSGMNGHIAKPIDMDEVDKVLKHYFQ